MNPLFIFLVFLGTFVLWILLAFLFKPIGNVITRLFNDVKKSMEIENAGKTEETRNTENEK